MATCRRSRVTRSVVSAVLFVLAAGAAGAESASKAPSDLKALYEQSIYDAAVKRPSFNPRLTPIPASQRYVTVQTLRTRELPVEDPSPFGPRERDVLRLKRINAERGVLLGNIFVALPKEARRLCRGAADPLLALQQGLGLPPNSDPDYRIVRFRVARADLFRPCASGPDVGARKCAFDVPQDLDPAHRAFMLNQMWTSYRTGFDWPGYPFTGMGWTWNWNPGAADRYGASEYVVRKGAEVARIRTLSVAEVCGGSD
jgi:hypothetical protein